MASGRGLHRTKSGANGPRRLPPGAALPTGGAFPGGESLQDVLTRTVAALREAISRHPKDTAVLVGHASVNRVILLHALDLPLSRYRRVGQDPCAINVIDFVDGDFTVQSVNETWHLRQVG